MLRRIALALAAVAVLVVGLVLLNRKEDRTALAQRTETRLPSFDDRAVKALVLETRSATWRFVRAPSGWRIAAPVDDVADPQAVEALIGAARRAPIVQTIDAPDALSSYGLAPPDARLTLEGVTTPALELGRVAPTGEAVYARLAGRPGVLLLGLPDAIPLAEADPAALRDRSLVGLTRSEIVGLEIAQGGLRLARGADGWWIAAPRRFPASAANVDKFLGALYDAKVVGWDDTGSPSDPRYGLGGSAPRVTLRADGAAQTITIGAEAGNGRRFVLSGGRKTILLAEAAPLASIPFDAMALRETRLTNVNRYGVTRLVYTSGGARFAATRNDEATWTTDAGGTIPAESVYTFLVALLEAETAAWFDGKLPAAPSATLLYVTDKGGTGRLAFARDCATWDALPGVVFRLAKAPPPVPFSANLR
jgi:hypothetical protein